MSINKEAVCHKVEELEILRVISLPDLGHIHEDVPNNIRQEVELDLDPGEVAPEVEHVDRELVAGQKGIEDFLLPKEHNKGLLS